MTPGAHIGAPLRRYISVGRDDPARPTQEKPPLKRADSPCQGEMSRRDRGGRDGGICEANDGGFLIPRREKPPVTAWRRRQPPFQGGLDRAAQVCRPYGGAPGSSRPSSSQAPYPSLPPDGESSLIPLLRLSPPNPRLSPLGFGGGPIIAPLVKGGWHRRKAVTGGFR